MTCAQTSVWMLTAGSPEDLPHGVSRHIAHCPRCQRRLRRLNRLHHLLADLPPPESRDAGREQFLRRLAVLPAPGRRPPRPAVGWHGSRWLFIATAAASVLLVLGLLLPPFRPTDTLGPPSGSPMPPANESLVARLVHHDLKLAQTLDPAEQLDALTAMAGDLKSEMLRQAQQAGGDDLALMGGLYERVIHQGWLGRAQALPEGQQRDRLKLLIRELRDTETQTAGLVVSADSGAHEALRSLKETSHRTRTALEAWPRVDPQPIELMPLPSANHGTRALLTALVLNGVQLAEADDELRRAELCQDVAGRLLQTMMLASARGDRLEAAGLSKQLGLMLDRGVTGNLTRLQQDGSDDPRLTEVEQALHRAAIALQEAGSEGNQEAHHEQIKAIEKALRDLDKVLKKVSKEHKPGPPSVKGPPQGKPGPPANKPPDKKPRPHDDD